MIVFLKAFMVLVVKKNVSIVRALMCFFYKIIGPFEYKNKRTENELVSNVSGALRGAAELMDERHVWIRSVYNFM